MRRSDLLEALVDRVVESVTDMERRFDSVNGPHEAYGLLAEEVDRSGMLFMSNPPRPRRGRHCRTCGKTDTVSIDDDN